MENKVKTVKERLRADLSTLLYKLPRNILPTVGRITIRRHITGWTQHNIYNAMINILGLEWKETSTGDEDSRMELPGGIEAGLRRRRKRNRGQLC